MSGIGLLPFVRRWGALLAAGALAAALIAWLFAATAGKTYEAEAKLLVGPVNADYPTLQAAGALGRTYAELAHSRPIVEAAAASARLRLTPDQVRDAVTATSNDVTRILDVQVRASDPHAAARFADALATQLVQVRRRAPAADVDPVVAIMREPAVADLSARQRHGVREAALHVIGESNAGDLRLVEGPAVPKHAVSPRVALLVVLAALAGALAVAAFAIVREGLPLGPEWDGPQEDFDVERFLPSANGASETRSAAMEQWPG
jgi:uncharacterized protein involved in exopolysaccharide biosynthesis